MALLWRQVFGSKGVFNEFLSWFGIQGKSWITHPDTAIYTLIVLLVWQFGSPMVIFLAGLKQIPADLYEAASIDGAGAITRFFNITLPLLTPIIFFNWSCRSFPLSRHLRRLLSSGGEQGGTLDSTLFYTLYLYIKGFQQFQMGYAAAMAWMLLLIIALLRSLLSYPRANGCTTKTEGGDMDLRAYSSVQQKVLFTVVRILALVMIYPLLWMISSSLKPESLIFRELGFIPSQITLENYIQGWKGFSGISFTTFFTNSFIIVAFAILGNLDRAARWQPMRSLACSLT